MESGDERAVVQLPPGGERCAALLKGLIQAGFAVADYGEDARALEDVYFAQVRK